MSRRANITRHGANHAAGGSDPIPGTGCCPPDTVCVPWPDRVAGLAAANPGGLRGFWRLGDGASPFADTSGYSGGPANAVKTSTGTAMTDSITGALPAGDDDDAVQFNNTTGAAGDYLHASSHHFNFDPVDGNEMTVTAWVKPEASPSTFTGQVVGIWEDSGFGNCGWRLTVGWPTRTPSFQRRETGSSATSKTVTGSPLTADAWAFLAATYDTTNGARLYVNGVLVASDATIFGGLPTFNDGVNFGRNSSGGPFDSFDGGVDEVTIWGVALTGSEIADLYTSGLPCVSSADAGKVITADGDGATAWAYPTIAVDSPAGRYDTINVGDGLAGTDEGDGSLTLEVDVDNSTIETASPIRVKDAGITEAKLGLSDVTTANVSTSKHGLTPKLPNDATKFLDGTGAWSTVSGGDPATDTKVWMPLTTTVGGDDVLVFDASHQLIPTLTPI